MNTATKTCPITKDEAEDFLFAQADFLDDRNYEEWLTLFAPDAWYWIPARPTDTDPDSEISFMFDDFPMMVARCERLLAAGTAGQQPLTRSSHIIGNVQVVKDGSEDGEIVVKSRFHVTQFRRDVTKFYAGGTTHTLVRTDAGLRIKLQRVNLIDCDGIHDYILQVYL